MSIIKANGAGDQSTGFFNGVATQSLRIDEVANANLSWTPSSAGNRKKWTFSTWIKRSELESAGDKYIFGVSTGSNNNDSFMVLLLRADSIGCSCLSVEVLKSTKLLRDTSAWYHVLWVLDTANATESNRMKIYVNGDEITSWLVDNRSNSVLDDTNMPVLNTQKHHIGRHNSNTTSNYNGYLAYTELVEGQALAPTSFGETKNGVWIPKRYTGDHGTYGFRLQFNQTGTGTGSSSTVGADSANSNHFDSSGIDAEDCDMPDSPENNFATLNPLSFFTDNQLENGSLELDHQTTSHRANTGTMFMQTGKWYFEVYNTTSAASGLVAIGVGLQDISKLLSYASGDDNYVFYSNNNNAKFVSDTSEITLGTGGTHVPTAGSIIQVAYDADTGNIFIGVNNTYIAEDGGSDGNPATGANPTKTLSTNIDYIPFVGVYNNIAIANFGQDSTFAGATTAGGNADGNGKGDFKYSVPSGFLALCSANISDDDLPISPNADTQADEYFNTVLYTGNGGTIDQDFGFDVDLVWYKNRGRANTYHYWFDTVRGANKALYSNDSFTEDSQFPTLNTQSFIVNGSRIVRSSGDHLNFLNDTYVSWGWKAGGTAVSNTDGSITSSVSANTDAGFSIVTYTGTGSGATVGHGVGKELDFIIIKRRSDSSTWAVYSRELGSGKKLELDGTSGTITNAQFFTSNPTSSVFSLGTEYDVNGSGGTFVAYCFAEIEGYSKFGSYTGNGDPDGTFVYLGFRPAFLLYKRTDSTGNWLIDDNKTSTYNYDSNYLLANSSNQEGDTTTNSAGHMFDHLSNGFKMRNTNAERNASGGTFIYMAFAENPFKYANAR